jgi:uncharacterized damage-inducible protein DinB
MTVKDMETLYDYSYWANAKLFPVVSSLSADDFGRRVAGSLGSVRNTLVHMMSAEGGWLERAGGPKRGAALNADDFPTAASVTSYWTVQEDKVRGFLAALTDTDLATPREFSLPQLSVTGVLTIGEMLHHAVNHSIHHRGQVALLLRQLGHAPGNVDIMFYYGQRRAST